MIVGMEKYAMAHNNFDIIQELVNSPLTAETSVHAQELGMLAERDLDSAVVAIRKANQIKKQALEEKLR